MNFVPGEFGYIVQVERVGIIIKFVFSSFNFFSLRREKKYSLVSVACRSRVF